MDTLKEKSTQSFMQRSAIASFLLLCFFINEPLIVQQANFRHLSFDDGLSQNAVFSIIQNSRGFIWIGITVQFVRVQCVKGMSAKFYNPDEERGAGNRLGLSFANEFIKARRAKSLQKP